MTSNVLSIAVVKPNVPLRDIDGKADFSFKNFTVWDHSQSDTRKPVSVDMTEPRINLLVMVAGEGAFEPGREYKLSGKFSSGGENLTFDDATFSVEQDATSTAVPVSLNGYSSTIPWGVKDSVEWSIDGTHITKTPIELYAIAPAHVLPPYLRCEISAEFLELMLIPILKHKLKENYIDYAIRVCHGSSTINKIHTYKYANVYGGPAFTWGYTGDDYDLKLWLINRIDDEEHKKRRRGENRITRLNCYDQAGLVLIAAPLGFTDTSVALHWYYMAPYGYIDADLVGWGKCNNPYFGNKEWSSEQVTKESDDPKRSKFKNHAFVVMVSGDNKMVLDACAGPHTGELSLEDYITNAIDHNDPPEGWEKVTGTIEDASNIGAGIETVASVHTIDIASKERKFLDRLHEISRTSKDKDGDSMSISLANMTKDITAKYSDKQFGEPMVNNRHKPEISILKWTSLDDGDITIEMHVFGSYGAVQHAWNMYFLSVNNPPEYLESFTKPQEGTEKGTHNLIGPDVIIWISAMTLVKVIRAPSSNTPDSELKAIADVVHASMLTGPATSDLKQDLDEVSAELSIQNPIVGDEFYITVTAPKVGYIQALVVNNRALLMNEEPTELGKGKWRFQYRALAEGDETVKLVCSHLETFEANVKPFSFQVGAAQ